MNFALPAILLFLIVLPGFLFRTRFKRAEQTSLDYSPFGRVVAEGFLWAFALHLVWVTIAHGFGQSVHPATLVGLLSSSPELQAEAARDVSASASPLVVYFATLYAFATLLPTALRAAISHWRLDRSEARLSGLFRFNDAPWYYLLTGADFEPDEEPDYIAVAAIVDVAGTAYLYVGILADFFFGPDGQLDRMVLESVARRPMARDKGDADEDRFYDVEGDYFVIRYAEVITLNVKYFKLAPVDTPVEEPVR